eukprot:350910-Chlamydomonas_euryale.AAC.8
MHVPTPTPQAPARSRPCPHPTCPATPVPPRRAGPQRLPALHGELLHSFDGGGVDGRWQHHGRLPAHALARFSNRWVGTA